MRRWIFKSLAAPLCLSAVVFCGAATVTTRLPAQQLELTAPAAATSHFEEVLNQGELLERARRWGEALGHYEAAVKEFPGQAELKDRLTRSRIHFDLGRRYADGSYLKSLGEMNTAAALELYGEILLKIHTHYVEAPNWQELLARGAKQLETALDEPAFVAQNLRNVSPDAIAAFRRELPMLVASRQAQNRQDAQQMAADVAYRAAQQLGIAEPAIILEFACGAMGGLDPYSSFLSAAQLDDLFSQIEGNFVGLGIELKTVNNSLEVVGVIEGSPADRGGMRIGDRIIGVDGQTTRDNSPDVIADMLKGPEGSQAIVTLVDKHDAERRLRVIRERVDVPSVERVQMLDQQQGVGYFRITSFQKTTSRDVDAALWKLHREGLRYLIIDVRGNPGGLLTGSVEVADKFVQQGTIVSTRGRSAQEDFDYKAHNVGTWRVPLVVLIDGDSASASEIFAGAIHDHRRGTIVGVRSYGKGSVQGIFPLQTSKAGVRLTTAKFFSPSGQAISDRGVSPDVEVRTTAKPIIGEDGAPGTASDTDPVLQAGLQIAHSQLSQRALSTRDNQ